VIFPPGGTYSRTLRPVSPWREFSFALHQLQHALHPTLPLADLITRWTDIADDLAERPRKRKNAILKLALMGRSPLERIKLSPFQKPDWENRLNLQTPSLPRPPGAPYLARFSRDVGYHEPNPQILDDSPPYIGKPAPPFRSTAKKLDSVSKPFDHLLIRFRSLPQSRPSSKSKNTSPLHGPEHLPVI
jgi:hypothetical protein